MNRKILITAALPYANGDLHLGHVAGCFLGADIIARFERLSGNRVLFVSGSDCYGVAVQLAAEKRNISPEELVRKYHDVHKQTLDKLNISYDVFDSTLNAWHKDVVQSVFNKLVDAQMVDYWESNMLFSEARNMFVADRYVIGRCPKCNYNEARGDECQKCGAFYQAEEMAEPLDAITRTNLILKPSTHWFLRLDKLKNLLTQYIQESSWASKHKKFLLHYVANVEPRCISRDLSWGVPLGNNAIFANKVFYVWFDALLGYISISKAWSYSCGNPDMWQDFWLDKETTYLAFMGKDNLVFHGVVFPAILSQMANIKKIDEIIANDFYLFNNAQFSKSDNNYVGVLEAIDRVSVDTLRYYMASSMPENGDVSFSWECLMSEVNATLVGNIGNFVNRVFVVWNRHFVVTDLLSPLSYIDQYVQTFIDSIYTYVNVARDLYNKRSIKKVVDIIRELGFVGNKFFSEHQLWEMVRENKERANQFLSACFLCIDKLALVAAPIMPSFSEKITNSIRRRPDTINTWEKWANAGTANIIELITPDIMFAKLE